ncbi:hypothetical protein BC739_006336 [Kutzneria viridogrisea]|uniref:Uncharacterized protein n=1 Tax=Kutzneria viridogrisea TaxID=47990 RepID=A0ABR6BQG6_9PSEU|nr:hypothetical protein [Kutzneria viridogrisea]
MSETTEQPVLAAGPVPVWRPPADRPAGQDNAVAVTMTALAKAPARMVRSILLLAGSALVLVLASRGINLFSGLVLAMAALTLVSYATFQARVGQWLPAMRRLLGGVPERVRVRVVAHQGNQTVLAVQDGAVHLRVGLVTSGLRQVIQRANEVWLIGPDANGDAVVFADAFPVPLPARVVPAPTGATVDPLDAGTSMHPAEDKLAVWGALRVRARVRNSLLSALVVVLVVFAAYGLVGDLLPPGAAVGAVVGVVVVSLMMLAGSRQVLRLPTLLRAADQWTSFPVVVQSWLPRQAGGPCRLVAYLPDGTQVPVLLPRATVDVVANISATGTLWVAGTPQRGRFCAVGVPGYPIIAVARV